MRNSQSVCPSPPLHSTASCDLLRHQRGFHSSVSHEISRSPSRPWLTLFPHGFHTRSIRGCLALFAFVTLCNPASGAALPFPRLSFMNEHSQDTLLDPLVFTTQCMGEIVREPLEMGHKVINLCHDLCITWWLIFGLFVSYIMFRSSHTAGLLKWGNTSMSTAFCGRDSRNLSRDSVSFLWLKKQLWTPGSVSKLRELRS